MHRLLAWGLLLFGILLTAATSTTPTVAQDFRIYTTVTDLSTGDKSRPRLLSKSMTLFHAGKVYDYLESAEETVIHEPAQSRFLVLNRRHNLATEITHDEIRRYLGLAHAKARELITEWQRDSTTGRGDIETLEFQLLPEFQVRADDKSRSLSLLSPRFRYDVTCAAGPSSELVQSYLKSADWTAQLNSVLHPHSLLPEPRLRLNDELRERHLLPVEVELHIEGDRPVHLKAVHEWTWKLYPKDRAFIDLRETQIRQPEFRVIPFREFQRETLAVQVRPK